MPRVLNKRTYTGSMENVVYVGRPTPWGNPFIVGKHGAQGECVRLHAEWIKGDKHQLEAAKKLLKGKDLMCWCAPLPCHADTLLRIANEE